MTLGTYKKVQYREIEEERPLNKSTILESRFIISKKKENLPQIKTIASPKFTKSSQSLMKDIKSFKLRKKQNQLEKSTVGGCYSCKLDMIDNHEEQLNKTLQEVKKIQTSKKRIKDFVFQEIKRKSTYRRRKSSNLSSSVEDVKKSVVLPQMVAAPRHVYDPSEPIVKLKEDEFKVD